MKTIEENNKLIAEFMGLVTPSIHGEMYINDPDVEILITDCGWHNSWDWLMPVISKLNFECKIIDNIEMYEDTVHAIEDAVWTNDISQAYQYVIEFITEYNKSK